MPCARKQFTKSNKNQTGGSPASDMVGAQVNQKALTEVVPEGCPLKGNMNSLNLYQTTGGGSCGSMNNKYKATGGARHRRSSRKTHKSHRKTHRKIHHKSKKSHRKGKKSRKSNNKNNKNNRRNKTMRGGGSDWISSQYSLGNINAPESEMWKQFSASSPAGRNDLMNPPTLGLAGSGAPMGGLEGAGVKIVGAPLV